MLQMHHIRALRKQSQAVDNNMAACLHPGGLGTEVGAKIIGAWPARRSASASSSTTVSEPEKFATKRLVINIRKL